MKASSFSGSGGNKMGITLFVAMAVLLVYMIWSETNGEHMPEWLLWASTIF